MAESSAALCHVYDDVRGVYAQYSCVIETVRDGTTVVMINEVFKGAALKMRRGAMMGEISGQAGGRRRELKEGGLPTQWAGRRTMQHLCTRLLVHGEGCSPIKSLHF